MQHLSIVQWHHFAYMILSVALLGFGAAGTFLSLFRQWLLDRFTMLIPLLLILTGLSMAHAANFSNAPFIRFDTYLLFNDYAQLGRLFMTYLLFFVPFFFGALAIGLCFVRFSDRIGELYFANLLGSGLGGLVALALMWVSMPWELPAVLALFPLLAGLLTLPKKSGAGWKIFAGLALVLTGFAILYPQEVKPSEYKDLSKTLLLPEAEILLERHSPYGLVQAVSSPVLRHAPGLSLKYRQPVPVQKAVFLNGDWFGALIPFMAEDTVHIFDYTTGALPFVIGSPDRILLLNAGAGEGAARVLAHEPELVAFVEPNPVILSLFKEELAPETHALLLHPDLEIFNMDARTFLWRDASRFDLILLPVISAFGGTSGLNAIQEQYALTVEAMREMWQKLGTEGMISIDCWMDYPVRSPLRLLATLVTVLEKEGIPQPGNHIAAVMNWGMITFVLKKSPLTDQDTTRIKAFCREMLFDPVLLPGVMPGKEVQYNQMQDSFIFRYMDKILSPQRAAFYKEYEFNIRPSTDDRPYFSQFLRLKKLPYFARLYGSRTLPFLEVGYLIVLITLLQIAVISAVLILLPLIRLEVRGGKKGWTLWYFSGIGIGYMFVEIAFIQQFVLFFGNPVYSVAAVISCLLLGSGLGSLYSSKLNMDSRKLLQVAMLIIITVVLYGFLLKPLLQNAVALPLWIKLACLFLLVGSLGFVMGMPFPGGISYLSKNDPKIIPWAWGINGYFSVVSTALATVIAVEMGFFWVMIFAALAYALPVLVNIKK